MATVSLEQIQSPHDLRELDREGLAIVTAELREFVLQSVSQTGGTCPRI